MDDILTYFKNKKNLINLLVFLVLVLALPLGIQLIRQQQIFSSRASTDPIKFTGPNVETRAGKQVALKPQIALELVSHLGQPAGTTRTAQSETLQMSLLPKDLVKTVYAQGCTDESEFNIWGPCVSCSSAYFCCDSNPDICNVYGAYPGQCDSDPACTGGGSQPPQPPPSCSENFLYNECIGCNTSWPVYQNSCSGQYSTGGPQTDYNCGGYCGGDGSGTPPTSSCFDQFLYNQCVGCNLSEAVYQNSCTGEYSNDPAVPDYTGQCSGYCEEEPPPPPPDGGPEYCDGYSQLCPVDDDNYGTQFCYGGSIQSDTGACGYDPQFTSRCDPCQVNIGPQPGQCPQNATACWIGDPANPNCSDQAGADAACVVNHEAGSVCTQTEGQQNTYDDGCTIPTPTGQCSLSASPTNIQTSQKIRWTITSSPAGATAKWFGQDLSSDGSPVIGFANTGNWSEEYQYNNPGSYSRTAKIYDENGNIICTTKTVSVQISGSPIGITPSVSGVTIPVSSQQKPYPPGSKQTATVNFKDSGHVDTYYIGPQAGSGTTQSGGSSTECTYPGLLGCVRECQPVANRPATASSPYEKWIVNGKIVLDDNCWQLADFTTPSGILCKDGRPARQSNCVPVTCTNFDPKIHYDPANACFGTSTSQSQRLVQAPSTGGQVLQASTTTGTSTRVKTLSSGESGKQFEWTAPTQPGKYNFVANAHKITFDKSNNHNSDWDPNAGDKGCAWDGFVYLPGTPLQKTSETCSNTGPKEFWVGTTTGSPPPGGVQPPGGIRSPSPAPGRSPSPGPGVPTTRAYKIAEDPASLANAPEKPYTQEPTLINWEFSDKTPGKKFIWVEFIASNGQTKRENASIDLLGPDPTITSCSLDITGQNVTFLINGSNFGSDKGTVKSDSQNLTPSLWKETEIRALWVNPPIGETFPVLVTRPDGQKIEGQCSSIAQIFFSGNLFCPQVNKAQEFKGELVVKEATPGATPRREKITLRGGIIKDLETRLEEGVSYQIGLKVERGLRKLFGLTAQKGTTNINGVILPLGDIAPIPLGDGEMNAVDKSELNRQWGPIKGTKNCDLNSDQVCNSFEWACMRQFFNDSDEEEPK